MVSSPHGSFPKTSFPFSYKVGPDRALVECMLTHMSLPTAVHRPLLRTLHSIYELIFCAKEAFLIEVERVVITADGQVGIELGGEADAGVRVYFDDAAYKSCKRHSHIWSLCDEEGMAPEEVQAGVNGIVYIKLAGDSSSNGTTIVKQAMKPHIGCLGTIC